jgi:hypothetical protein
LNGERQFEVLTRGSFLSLKPPVKSFVAHFESLELSSGDALHLELELESEQTLRSFSIKVLFYNARGAFAADGLISSVDLNAGINIGSNRIQIQIPSVPLKNGMYAVAFNIIDAVGDLVVWSYKQHVVQVRGAYVGGIADCHLNIIPNNPDH